MDCMSTILVELEHQECQKPPYLTHQMLKWFYDTSTGTATRVARYGSFVGEGLGLSDVSYGGTRWDLRGSGHRSVTPYAHGRMGVVLQFVVQALS
jgi:hypothetical protein